MLTVLINNQIIDSFLLKYALQNFDHPVYFTMWPLSEQFHFHLKVVCLVLLKSYFFFDSHMCLSVI